MTLLRRYLRDDRFSLLGWSLGVLASVAMVLSLRPAMSANSSWQQLVDSLPSWFRAFAGGAIDITGPSGWLSLKWFSWAPLLIGTAGVLSGAGLVARDVETRSIEFLLAQPVRRWRVVLERYLGVALELVALNLVGAAALELGGRYWLDVPGQYAAYRIVAGNQCLLTLFFAAVATLVSVLAAEQRRAVTAGMGLLFGAYILDLVLQEAGKLQWLRAFTPFCYCDFGATLGTGRVPWGDLGVLLAGTVVALAAAAWALERKDIAG